MRALFIGRFQPFHNGHLSVVKQALKENDHLYIGIGSSQYNYVPLNPLTAAERIQIIQAALEAENIPKDTYTIILVPNIENYALWPRHVELHIPPFENLYTGSPVVKKLFEEYNKKLKKPYNIIPVQKKHKISSTEIRQKMVKKKPWEKYVPKKTVQLLQSFDLPGRLKAMEDHS